MKIIIDILMFITIMLEFSRNYMNPLYHEILGIILLILVIIHLILNKNYFKNIFKGKYNLTRYLMIITNIGLFIFLFVSILFGVLSSQELLKALSINNLTIISLHKIFAYISLIFLSMHLGININAVLKNIKLNKIVKYIIETIIIICGIYSFIKLDFIKHLTGEYGFSYNTNIVLNILEHLNLILMFVIITKYINKLLLKVKK